MARQTREPLRLDLNPIVSSMGMDWVIEQLGARRVIEQVVGGDDLRAATAVEATPRRVDPRNQYGESASEVDRPASSAGDNFTRTILTWDYIRVKYRC
jgi:hypothetical protein